MSMDTHRPLHQLLRALRERSGLSVSDVHRTIGVSRATAYHWEGEDSRPTARHLQSLLDLYGATDRERLEAWESRAFASPEEAA